MIIFVIIGAFIGAGFASGQEIHLFFYRYGVNGIVGLAVCSVLIGLVIYKTFSILLENKEKNINFQSVSNKKKTLEVGDKRKSIVKSNNDLEIKSYKNFLDKIFRVDNSKSKYLNLSYITNIIINIFLVMTFFIMISGFGAYFEQEFNLNSAIGAVILAMTCFIVFLGNIQWVAKVSSFIVPILIFCIAFFGLLNLMKFDVNSIGTNLPETQKGWFLQSIIYCSYNMILVMPVLISLRDFIKSKEQIVGVSILCSVIIFILGVSIFLLLTKVDVDFNSLEMPAVFVVSNYFKSYSGAYGFIILSSIFSTAISIGVSFLENVSKSRTSFIKISALMCICSILVSNIGFSNLVKFLFPAFGYLGFIQILIVLRKK